MATDARDYPWYRIHAEKLLNDVRLRRLCKENARALYYEGRHLMHAYGKPYGHLSFTPGVAMTAEQIGDLLVMGADTVQSAMQLLTGCGLWQKTAEGVAYDPELVEIMETVQRNRTNGGKGGNPNLRRPVNHTVNHPVNHTVNPPLTLPLSSSSPSGSEKEREKREREPFAPPNERAFLDAFNGEGIDVGYLRKKFADFENNNDWLNKHGRPRNFVALVRGYWKKDEPKWRKEHAAEEPEHQ